MANFSSRVHRLEGPARDTIVVHDIDQQLLALVEQNPCLTDHKSPKGLDPEDHLLWLDQLLEHHRRHGPCDGTNPRNEEQK